MAADTTGTSRCRTRLMGCDASILVFTNPSAPVPAAALAERGIERLGELERRWSRFETDSEISRLNRGAGAPHEVSTDTVRLVEMMVRAWYATDRAFDPTLLAALVGLGYAASRDDETKRTSLAPSTGMRGRPDAILVDATASIVQLPKGTALDPGGIGKGLAADIVTGELVAAGGRGVVVEVGGDLRVSGVTPGGGPWEIALDPCRDGSDHRRVRICAGGVATSTGHLRTWSHGERHHHHLLDPRTLAPSRGDVASCTVIAGSAAWAEAFTKVPFVHGADEALEHFEAHSLAASITTDDGRRHDSTSWEAFRR